MPSSATTRARSIYWAPLLDGQLKCAEEPHRVLAKSLLPLVRTGRADEARRAFLRGYPLAQAEVSLCAAVGGHIEFCALTGNEARGLEILAEHTAWLTDTQLDTADRLSFLAGVSVLLRRLAALGYGAVPAGLGTVAGTASVLEAELRDLCGRYDARNRSSSVSDRVAAQLAQEPLLERLPLGLPDPAAAGGSRAGAAAAGPPGRNARRPRRRGSPARRGPAPARAPGLGEGRRLRPGPAAGRGGACRAQPGGRPAA